MDVDFAEHAEAMGSVTEKVDGLAPDRTYIIVVRSHPYRWTPGDAGGTSGCRR